MSYQGGGRIRLPGNPGNLRKGDARIAHMGSYAKCPACGKPKGQPFIMHAKLPKETAAAVVDAAFAADIKPIAGPCMVGVLATWPSKWGKKGRAEGRPMGDVDAPVSNLLDALAGVLYADDAQVAVLVAVNAIGTKDTARIDVVARPLSPTLLALLEAELGLGLTSARLTLGQQGKLL